MASPKSPETMPASMNKKEYRPQARGIFHMRLGIVIFLASLFSIFLAEIAVLIPSLYVHEERLLETMRKETTRLVKVATLRNTLDDQTEKELIDILEKLSRFSLIKGGQLYDSMGDPVGGFGTEASLSQNSVATDGMQTLRSPNGKYFDIYIPQAQSGIGYDLILRLDASHIGEHVRTYLIRIVKSTLLVSCITLSGILGLLYFIIIRPIGRIKNAVIEAINDPDSAEDHQLGFSRGDEIGETGRAVDQLLRNISIVYQTELSAAHDAISQAMSAIIQYDPDGNLISANPAALSFFCTGTLEELKNHNQKFLILPERHETRRFSLKETFENRLEDANGGSYIENGYALVNGLEIPVLVIARPVRNRDGNIQRYFANLVDITKLALQKDQLQSDNDRLTRENHQTRQRNEELKKLMESCLILLNSATAKPTRNTERKPVMPDRIVINWYRDAQKSGLMHSAELEHGAMPVVMGRPERQEALFRQALTLVYLRSKYETPQLTLAASRKENGVLQFTVFDMSEQAKLIPKEKSRSEIPDWKICYAAFSQLLSQEKGVLIGFDEDKYENAVVFELPGAPADSQVALQESNFAA